VTKDDVKVAVLTFTKSAYRLGETVLGIVEINERGGRGKVISVSYPDSVFFASFSQSLHRFCILYPLIVSILTHITAKRNARNE
jgi:hypothetical protein